jgi:arginine exporter protein ArgO
MTAALVAGLVAGYGIAMPVGAVGTYLVTVSARTSLRVGLAASLGVATADGLYALVAVLGGTALAAAITPVAGPLRVVSALVLIALAVRITLNAVRTHRRATASAVQTPPPVDGTRAYVSLLGVTLVNPTTVVYFAALVTGDHSAVADSVGARTVFVLAAFGASASWQAFLAVGGAVLGRALAGRRARLVTALASGVVITVLAVRLLTS